MENLRLVGDFSFAKNIKLVLERVVDIRFVHKP